MEIHTHTDMSFLGQEDCGCVILHLFQLIQTVQINLVEVTTFGLPLQQLLLLMMRLMQEQKPP